MPALLKSRWKHFVAWAATAASQFDGGRARVRMAVVWGETKR